MPTQPLIVGTPVLVVVDIQKGGGMPAAEVGIAHMPGHAERVERAGKLLAAARAAGVPVVFFQEVHRPSGVDFGRELDGTEGVHCVAGEPGTDLEDSLRPLPEEFHIVKRRYSGFIGTDFEIVLRRLGASTLILIGGLTDVCVHYTFADAHQATITSALSPTASAVHRNTSTTRRWPPWSTSRPARCALPRRPSMPSNNLNNPSSKEQHDD